ncbi:endospore germination permease [Tumebacillus sp. ITR2]|uniref:Endospore germination permease n=1 Tax=Tumebacillus amylolyticus TaxID=2801339 RepID=A0ABS1J4X5_9BACL|nr:endospore germination permease [Tumebacillus amylolyticus]MBL0385316.1 endospore germination permease [Tumebacillus amylolyticus]
MAERKQVHMLNQRQFAWMIATVLISGGLVSLPKSLMELAKLDAWFSQALGMAYAFYIAYFLCQCARRFPGKNLFEINFLLCGRFGGGLINALFLFFIWMVLVRDTRGFADFMNSTLLLKTPEEFTILMFLLVVVYYCKSSVEVAARVNDLMFPLFMVVLFGMPFLLTNEFSFARLEPILGHGFPTVLVGNLLPMGWYGDTLIMGAFLHTITASRQIHSAVKFGVTLAGVGLTLLMFICICVLGSTVAGRMMYPNYTLVEQIHITDYLDRLELVMFSVWLPSFVLKVCFIFTAFLIGLNSFTKRTTLNLYCRQFGWLLLTTTAMAFHSVVEVFDFGNYGSILLVVGMQLPITILLFILLARQKRDHRERQTDLEIQAKEQERRNGPDAKWYDRVRMKTWALCSLGGLAFCFVCIGLGALLGRDIAKVGWTCGVVYVLVMFVLLFSTYMEMRQVRLSSVKPEIKQKRERKLA